MSETTTTLARMAREEQAASPHNTAAEMSVLGAMLTDNGVYDRIADLTEADFYAPANRTIWSASVQLIRAGQAADAVSLRRLCETDNFDALGGPNYLLSLLDCAAFGPEIGDYADILRDLTARRALVSAASGMLEMARSPDQKSAAELAGQAAQLLSPIDRGIGQQVFTGARDDALRFLETVTSADYSAGLSTGLKRLDDKIGGLYNGSLIIMAGRPGMGKTALASHCAFSIAGESVPEDETGGWLDEQGVRRRVVAFFSLEMPKMDLCGRAASAAVYRELRTIIPYERIRKGALNADEVDHVRAALKGLPQLQWCDQSGISMDFVASQMRAIKRRFGRLDAVFCDYLQIMDANRGRSENLAEALGRITGGAKTLAKQFDIPFVMLAQVNRNVEMRDNKRPLSSDLKYSGDAEQDADTILMIYRDYAYKKDMDPPSGASQQMAWEDELEAMREQVEVNATKARHGATGRTDLFWNDASGVFVNCREDLR